VKPSAETDQAQRGLCRYFKDSVLGMATMRNKDNVVVGACVIAATLLLAQSARAQARDESGAYLKGIGGAVFESGEPLGILGVGGGARISPRLEVGAEFVRAWGEAAYLSTLMADIELDVIQRSAVDFYVGGGIGGAWADYREPFSGPRNWGLAWNVGGGVRLQAWAGWDAFLDVRELFVHDVFSRVGFPRVEAGLRYSFP
jgi:hypothetical protein